MSEPIDVGVISIGEARGSGCIWRIEHIEMAGPIEALAEAMRRAALSQEELDELSARHQPAQAWYDESDDPFEQP